MTCVLFTEYSAQVFGHEDGGRILPFENREITFAKLAEEAQAYTATLIPNTLSEVVHKSVVKELESGDNT